MFEEAVKEPVCEAEEEANVSIDVWYRSKDLRVNFGVSCTPDTLQALAETIQASMLFSSLTGDDFTSHEPKKHTKKH